VSPSIRVQEVAAATLSNLSTNAENRVTIASAGIPRLIALLASPSVDVPDKVAGTLANVSADVRNTVTIASAGIPPLIALASKSPSFVARANASAAQCNLGVEL
jgi:hypothetical protein